jgi:hypothetical protein
MVPWTGFRSGAVANGELIVIHSQIDGLVHRFPMQFCVPLTGDPTAHDETVTPPPMHVVSLSEPRKPFGSGFQHTGLRWDTLACPLQWGERGR